MKKRIEITIETRRVMIIHRRRSPFWAMCEGCSEVVRMVSVDEASDAAGISVRAVCRLLEAGDLHFLESPDGKLRLCLKSILNLRRDDGQLHHT